MLPLMNASPDRNSAPATTLRREWKGERGLPVFIVQHGLGYRGRQNLADLLLEAADLSGGPERDAFALFRSLGVFAECGRDWLDRDAIREELGYQAWDDARPRLLDWRLVEESLATDGGVNHSYRVNPVVAMQLAPALNRLLESWTPIARRSWSGETLAFERERGERQEFAAREVASRLFDRAGARLPGNARGLLWLAIRKLVEQAGAELNVSKGSPKAPNVLGPLRYYHLAVDGSEEGKWRWNDDAPRGSFAATLDFLSRFEGVEREASAA
jgi:hypothetical protein